MKASEAPEKIYLEAIYPDNGVLPNGLNYTPSPTDIEYICKDVFIEKALEFIKANVDRIVNNQHGVCMGCMDKEFKEYINRE